MRAEIQDGELVVGTGAIREDGASEKLVPLAYPAIADRHVTAALEDAARELQVEPIHTGVVLTQGPFYYSGLLPDAATTWIESDIGVVAAEMEFAMLLVTASLHGARAGGIFTADGNLTIEPDLKAGYDPHRRVVEKGVERMLKVAIEALVSGRSAEKR
jgi:uridine phosphorylase